jgi:hemerythrin-like domain-containing protein
MTTTTLRTQSPDSSERAVDAIDLLLSAHHRIRTFTGVAVRLLIVEGLGPKTVTEAASAVHRYFADGLPLHHEDEDQSLMPRLRKHASENLMAALQTAHREHRKLEEVLARLLPAWQAIADDPQRLPAMAGALALDTLRFEQLWKHHLQLEEETIFPAARAMLPPDDMKALLREVHGRRSPDTFVPVFPKEEVP